MVRLQLPADSTLDGGGRSDSLDALFAPTALDVLLVESDPARGEAITFLLERDGQTVTCVAGHDAALTALADADFDIVITDLELIDRWTAWDLAREVRRRGINVGIIVASETDLRESHRGASLDLFDAVLPRPFDSRDLRHAVAAAVARRV
jgi:two-component system response regulator QseB